MKSKMMHWMIAAAALAAAAGSAAAQSYRAEIPLSFRVGKTLMLPGTYDVNLKTNGMVSLRNLDTNAAVLTVASVKGDPPRTWAKGKPVLGFECTGESCALHRLYTGRDSFAYQFPIGKLPAGEQRAAVVVMAPAKAD